ncbi:MAG: hypothetical protein ACK5G9_08390 [Akkermansiaceae bacterium]
MKPITHKHGRSTKNDIMINRTANSRTRLPGLIETQASTLRSQTKPAYENSSVEEIVDSR